MPIALIELQKELNHSPAFTPAKKIKLLRLPRRKKITVTRSKSESPRESRLPDERKWNDRPWRPKIRSGLFNCESIQERKMTWRTA